MSQNGRAIVELHRLEFIEDEQIIPILLERFPAARACQLPQKIGIVRQESAIPPTLCHQMDVPTPLAVFPDPYGTGREPVANEELEPGQVESVRAFRVSRNAIGNTENF